MAAKIVVIGSANTDMVVTAERFPRPGETVSGSAFHMFQGGKGANQAVAAARMGATVCFAGRVGNDLLGNRMISSLQEEGIDTSLLKPDATVYSGVAVITVDGKGENHIIVVPGANGRVSEAVVDEAAGLIAQADIVLLQLEIPIQTVLYAAKKIFQLGRKLILNPAPASELPEELLETVFLITPNETEAEKLTGVKISDQQSMERAADILLDKGVKNVIITLGSRGAYLKNRQLSLQVNSPRVVAVDTTAAGDVFNGVLASSLASGVDWKESMAFACRAASISVTRLGAQASMPTRMEMNG